MAAATFRGAILLVAGTAALSHLSRNYEAKFESHTAAAQWIWINRTPLARRPSAFFAVRTFSISKVRTTVVKIAADPSYELWINGRQIARQRFSGDVRLDSYDVTDLVVPGVNKVLVALRSVTGIGGLLVAIDTGTNRQNEIVTPEGWEIFDHWTDTLPLRTSSPQVGERPLALGSPPAGRWNLPERVERELQIGEEEAVAAANRTETWAKVPEVRVVSGVAILRAKRVPVTVFDFGSIHGRAVIERRLGGTEAVSVRYIGSLDELGTLEVPDALVIASGERAVADTAEHDFRYLVVYEAGARAHVLVPGHAQKMTLAR